MAETELKEAPEAEVEQASPEPGLKGPEPVESDAPPVEGAEPEAEKPSWWSAAENEESLRGHETVTGWLTEAREEGLTEARSEMQPRLDAQNQHARKLGERADGILESLTEIRGALNESDSEVTLEGLKKVLKDNAPVLDALGNVKHDDGYAEAFIGATVRNENGEPVKKMGVIEALFGDHATADPFIQRAKNAFEFGTEDKSFYSDLRKALTKQELAAAREGIEKELRDQIDEEGRAHQRDENNPPKPEGGGGGGSVSYKTQREVEAAHVNNKISSAEKKVLMRGLPY